MGDLLERAQSLALRAGGARKGSFMDDASTLVADMANELERLKAELLNTQHERGYMKQLYYRMEADRDKIKAEYEIAATTANKVTAQLNSAKEEIEQLKRDLEDQTNAAENRKNLLEKIYPELSAERKETERLRGLLADVGREAQLCLNHGITLQFVNYALQKATQAALQERQGEE